MRRPTSRAFLIAVCAVGVTVFAAPPAAAPGEPVCLPADHDVRRDVRSNGYRTDRGCQPDGSGTGVVVLIGERETGYMAFLTGFANEA
jgi:hypothetical protein